MPRSGEMTQESGHYEGKCEKNWHHQEIDLGAFEGLPRCKKCDAPIEWKRVGEAQGSGLYQ